GEYSIGKSKQWYVHFQHDVGITNQGLLFLQTTVPFAFYSWANSSGTNHYQSAYAALIMPSGFTYYYMHEKRKRAGLYMDPLNYAGWQTGRHGGINAINPEAGFKILRHLNRYTWMMVSAGA